ncbi:MAG TPA: alpha/beta fold hydrolase [Candidatus Angelobacter sp.]|nr:alpha/beta fold hydrolase [Candidatus Angelobacter sp.]
MIRSSMFRLFSLLVICVSTGLTSPAQQAIPARVVDLKAPDSANLKATFFAAARPGPGVMLLHQCNRQRKVWDDLARQLAAAGISVLTLDLRGFGESDGVPMDKATPQQAQAQAQKWPGDIDVAFEYLTSRVKRDDIGVGGASCGVNNSIQTAIRHVKEVKSLVLLSGNTDIAGRKFLRQSQLPVLAAVADDDEFPASIETTEWIFSLSSTTGNKFLHYTKGGHGAEIFAVHPELRDAIVDWYTITLIKTPGHAPASKERWQAPAAVQMLTLIDQPGGAQQAAAKLAQARKQDPKAVLFSEVTVNLMGYEHMQAGDVKGAIEILKLNAEAFPDSPNVYDSLGDVYLADGQKDLARENAKKAIEVLASDTTDPEARRNAIRDSAEQKLKQLGSGPQ